MIAGSRFNISRSNSAKELDKYGKRVNSEIAHLISDIRRINPKGSQYCKFGELFTDPIVEQYYEALVGTMKAAKKRGLITFPGQILLFPMHNSVEISILDGEKDLEPLNEERLKVITTIPLNNNTNQHSNKFESELTRVIITPTPGERANKRENENTNTDSKLNNVVFTRNQEIDNSIKKDKDYINPEKQREGVCDFDSSNFRTPSHVNYSKSGRKLFTSVAENVSAVAVTPEKDWTTVNSSPSAGIVSNSKLLHDTHQERMNREISQLRVDIQRIFPEGQPFCAFGDLYDDSEVEQYYEALIGTLRSAKRRGIVLFEGQMLLKGVHDKVKIELVT